MALVAPIDSSTPDHDGDGSDHTTEDRPARAASVADIAALLLSHPIFHTR